MGDKYTDILKQIGINLREKREAKGYTLRDLEVISGIDNGKISRMESGLTNITMITLYRLAEALEVSPHDLIP
jgi:transcriptional regulator with XRE-family HTH domain